MSRSFRCLLPEGPSGFRVRAARSVRTPAVRRSRGRSVRRPEELADVGRRRFGQSLVLGRTADLVDVGLEPCGRRDLQPAYRLVEEERVRGSGRQEDEGARGCGPAWSPHPTVSPQAGRTARPRERKCLGGLRPAGALHCRNVNEPPVCAPPAVTVIRVSRDHRLSPASAGSTYPPRRSSCHTRCGVFLGQPLPG